MAEGTMGKWWGRVLFGVVAVIFGIITLLQPGITLVGFLFLFGLFMLVSGLVLLAYGLRRERGAHRWLNIFEGVIDVGIAMIAFFYPGLTALGIVYLFAFFAIITGLLQLGESAFYPSDARMFGMRSRTFLLVSGLWSLLIGVLLVLFPGAGILALLWLIAIFAIVLGLFNIFTGIKMRSAGVAAPARR